ncbi:Csu type fimbrial protein [Hydrogenophaga sp.]|uniref:Csu type fimbrial protein n=1 Tax=Hydrogenophaga sp. TaxID=1904254 RepID=UPI003F719CD3
MLSLRQLSIFTACLLGAYGAHAASDTANLTVKVTITATCNIHSVSPTDVDFGSIQSTAIDTDAAGALSVNCTPGTDYTIGLDGGENFSGGERRMAKGTDYVAYELYRDAGRSQVWGNDLAGSLAGTGSGSAQTIPVYGRIASANSPAGDYTDVVIATVTY